MASNPLALPWRTAPHPVRHTLASPWVLTALCVLAVVGFWIATGSTPAAFRHLWTWSPALLRCMWANI